MIGEAGFRKAVRLERGVGRVVVYPAPPVAERMEKGPTMGGGGNGVSVGMRKFGEFWSNIVTTSTTEGLFRCWPPLFERLW
jgi:hypothetical protein